MTERRQHLMPDGRPVPEGLEFLKLVQEQEYKCEQKTDEWLPNAGIKTPQCLENLGTVLSLLDRLVSCWWGCRGGDHSIEYLVGRTYNTSRASLKLLRDGFYDEALALIRNIGEAGNILLLFRIDINAFKEWSTMSDSARRSAFSPVKVRVKLESFDPQILLIDKSTYSQLSESAIHVTPHTVPQVYNSLGIPVTGGYFQEAGAIAVLNELASVMWGIALVSPYLLDLDEDRRAEFEQASLELSKSTGIRLAEVQKHLNEIRDSHSFKATIEKV